MNIFLTCVQIKHKHISTGFYHYSRKLRVSCLSTKQELDIELIYHTKTVSTGWRPIHSINSGKYVQSKVLYSLKHPVFICLAENHNLSTAFHAPAQLSAEFKCEDYAHVPVAMADSANMVFKNLQSFLSEEDIIKLPLLTPLPLSPLTESKMILRHPCSRWVKHLQTSNVRSHKIVQENRCVLLKIKVSHFSTVTLQPIKLWEFLKQCSDTVSWLCLLFITQKI